MLTLLLACSGKNASDDTAQAGDDTAETQVDPLSDFTSGRYRFTSLTVDEEGGRDWNDDGVIDNNLPKVLGVFDLLLEEDLSPKGLNATMAAEIAKGNLVVLADVVQDAADLTLTLYSGTYDPKTGAVTAEGTGSSLEGAFASQTAYEVGPGTITVPIPIVPDEEPLPFPLEKTVFFGDADAEGLGHSIEALVPVDIFAEEIVDAIVPKEGSDLDGDGTIESNETRASILALVTTILSSPTQSDIEMEGGRRAVSGALRFEAEPTTWE